MEGSDNFLQNRIENVMLLYVHANAQKLQLKKP